MENIINQINEVLAEEFEIDQEEIQDAANLRETLDLDSLDYVDLVAAIQAITGVKLGEEDFKEVETFKDFYKVLENRMAEK